MLVSTGFPTYRKTDEALGVGLAYSGVCLR